MRAEQITPPVTWHGEGPFWDRVGQRMLVVDMLAGAVVDLTSQPQPVRHDVGSPVAAVIRRRAASGFIVATEHGFSHFDEEFSLERRLPDMLADPAIRLNEGGCDPRGRFFCGTMAYDEAPGAASLYRLEADGSTSIALTGITISNGLQWSHDGAHAYYVDTPTRRVDVFDFDPVDGSFHGRRPFVEFSDEVAGAPDGMAIDAEGGLWVALWGGGAVRRYDATGILSEIVEVPGVMHTSAAAFGGPALDTLYVTSSRQHLADDAEPQAGAVFAVRPGVRGALLNDYAG
ncbi:SMP-30/gluconolactonase/LRE family protein [Rathayibacter soli]|uniref:SMP-30/gluconolactonase/LRE family protein n=1 Tax=Rathayibacter soli TaxID=3144168 RepID=UPI0027E3C5BC|nr:SMP-30/gluconolactonase/LRE family protein [Glaciibacter superstes]